jgi:hypothetical protein
MVTDMNKLSWSCFLTVMAFLAVSLFQVAGCLEESTVAQAVKPPILIYSARKERFTGIDPKGRPMVSPYKGVRVVLSATVEQVHLPGRSPSIAVEDATALFSFVGDAKIPNAPNASTLELRFDEHAGPGAMAKGDFWEIILTDAGELVDLRLLKKVSQK